MSRFEGWITLNLHNQHGHLGEAIQENRLEIDISWHRENAAKESQEEKEKQFILKASFSRTSHCCSRTLAKSGAKSPGPEPQYQAGTLMSSGIRKIQTNI